MLPSQWLLLKSSKKEGVQTQTQLSTSSAALHAAGCSSACCWQLFLLPPCLLHSTHGGLLTSHRGHQMSQGCVRGRKATHTHEGHAATASFNETSSPDLDQKAHAVNPHCPSCLPPAPPADSSLNPQWPGLLSKGPDWSSYISKVIM